MAAYISPTITQKVIRPLVQFFPHKRVAADGAAGPFHAAAARGAGRASRIGRWMSAAPTASTMSTYQTQS